MIKIPVRLKSFSPFAKSNLASEGFRSRPSGLGASLKSNKGLFEPISAFILIVVLAIGAVFSSNLVSQRTSQVSQASCPEGTQSCSEDYRAPCGENGKGWMDCHKEGCSKDGAGGVGCSWGAGSSCDTDQCNMPDTISPTPPPVIPESQRCSNDLCSHQGCYQGHWVGNDCCFHTELDDEKGCSSGETPTPTATLAPDQRPPVPTPDAGGEQKCPCEYQGRCYPNQETGYFCGNDCRLHPGSKEDNDNCKPKQPTPTLRPITPIRLTPTVTPIPAGKCSETCSGRGYVYSGCSKESIISIDKYTCGAHGANKACFLDKVTISNTECEETSKICSCGNAWDCNESSIPQGCNKCCQKTPTPTPTPSSVKASCSELGGSCTSRSNCPFGSIVMGIRKEDWVEPDCRSDDNVCCMARSCSGNGGYCIPRASCSEGSQIAGEWSDCDAGVASSPMSCCAVDAETAPKPCSGSCVSQDLCSQGGALAGPWSNCGDNTPSSSRVCCDPDRVAKTCAEMCPDGWNFEPVHGFKLVGDKCVVNLMEGWSSDGGGKFCQCRTEWSCNDPNKAVDCNNICPNPLSGLPKTCKDACGTGSNAICGGKEGVTCSQGSDKYCVYSEKKETQECNNCVCTRNYSCGDTSAPGECNQCCPQATGKICHPLYNMVCNLGDLTFISCRACTEGSTCESASPGMAKCEPKKATSAAADDTLSTFSGHGEASSPAKNAKITLKDPEGKKFVVKTDENGDYTITVPTDRVYDVTIESSGYKTLAFKWDSKMGLDYLMNFKLVKKAKAESGNFEIEEASKDRLLVGWNLISLPVKPSQLMRASDLIFQINQNGGLAVAVSRWQDGRWETYLAGLDKNDFVIEVGQAYFVENFNETQFKIEGEEITQPQTLDLKPGWNAIGLPKTANCPAASCSAKEMMNVLDKQVPLSARVFSQFESGLWQAISKEGQQFYGWDFVIKSTAGYFVKVNKAVQLLP